MRKLSSLRTSAAVELRDAVNTLIERSGNASDTQQVVLQILDALDSKAGKADVADVIDAIAVVPTIQAALNTLASNVDKLRAAVLAVSAKLDADSGVDDEDYTDTVSTELE